MALNKVDIVTKISQELGISRKDSSDIVESFFAIMKDELCQGNEVLISGFGKWKAMAKKKRNGRNPQTGAAMTIDARTVVTFKPSFVFRDALNADQ